MFTRSHIQLTLDTLCPGTGLHLKALCLSGAPHPTAFPTDPHFLSTQSEQMGIWVFSGCLLQMSFKEHVFSRKAPEQRKKGCSDMEPKSTELESQSWKGNLRSFSPKPTMQESCLWKDKRKLKCVY